MDRQLKLILPLRTRIGKTAKSKIIPLNLNTYRNMHFQSLNNVKVHFATLVLKELEKSGVNYKFLFKSPTITYRLFTGTYRKTDLMNWVSVIDKFLMDALVKAYVIQDDNTDIIQDVHIYFGGIDKDHERLEVELWEDRDG